MFGSRCFHNNGTKWQAHSRGARQEQIAAHVSHNLTYKSFDCVCLSWFILQFIWNVNWLINLSTHPVKWFHILLCQELKTINMSLVIITIIIIISVYNEFTSFKKEQVKVFPFNNYLCRKPVVRPVWLSKVWII